MSWSSDKMEFNYGEIQQVYDAGIYVEGGNLMNISLYIYMHAGHVKWCSHKNVDEIGLMNISLYTYAFG